MNSARQNPRWNQIGVIALVPDHWGPCWESRHQVLTRLAASFHVVWVDHPHGWRESFSALKSPRAAVDGPATPPGFEVYHPEFWLPLMGRPAGLARFTARQRLKRAGDRLRARGCTKLVLYIWRPEFGEGCKDAAHDLCIYHVDDEYTFSTTEVDVPTGERMLLESADQVFIHSPAMMRKKGGFNPDTEFVPNGVDYKLYATPVPEPEDLRPIPHPRIGYVGTLKRMLNWDLLSELSASHPEWSFVFVGPKAPHPEIDGALELMSRRSNVHFLGAKPTDRLGGYPQHFDVCMMPYRQDDYTKYIYPLKLHEYLASGRPVVSTPISSVAEFGHVVGLANHCQEWSRAITQAFSSDENTPAQRALRQKVAREHDWDVLVAKIAGTIATRLGIQLSSPPTVGRAVGG